MKKLNFRATKLFLRFLLKIQGLTESVLPAKDQPDLLIRKERTIHTEDGPAYLFTIGKLLAQRPNKFEYSMTFLVIDFRQHTGERHDLIVYPAWTTDELNDVKETSIVIQGDTIVSFNIRYQRAQANTAYSWLMELKLAGYLK